MMMLSTTRASSKSILRIRFQRCRHCHHPPIIDSVPHGQRSFTSSSSSSFLLSEWSNQKQQQQQQHGTRRVIDLRSDTVTSPSREMLQCGLTARTGDDVFGEDPTVLELEEYTANLFGKDCGLYVPTGTMANLISIMAHCQDRSSEIILGANSHICLWEGGNISNLGGIHSRQIYEHAMDATLDPVQIRELYRTDTDDHWPKTELLCLENSHNMMGGVALSPDYIHAMGALCHDELKMKLHIDGARIFNAIVVAHHKSGTTPSDMCASADSVSICLSKGLGAPMGSVVVGSSDMIRLAKRARKRCGGGMRQAGIVAAMGLYAIQHNVERLLRDHDRAQRMGTELYSRGFRVLRNGQIDTNIVYFALPMNANISKEEFLHKLNLEYGVKITGGYSRNGELFRACTHLDVNDEDVDRATDAILQCVSQ